MNLPKNLLHNEQNLSKTSLFAFGFDFFVSKRLLNCKNCMFLKKEIVKILTILMYSFDLNNA